MAKYYGVVRSSIYLLHDGVKGMRWGVRKDAFFNNTQLKDELLKKINSSSGSSEKVGVDNLPRKRKKKVIYDVRSMYKVKRTGEYDNPSSFVYPSGAWTDINGVGHLDSNFTVDDNGWVHKIKRWKHPAFKPNAVNKKSAKISKRRARELSVLAEKMQKAYKHMQKRK